MTAALQDSTCAGTRGGGSLNCTAGEFTINAVVQEATGSLPTCTIGGSAEFDVLVNMEGSNTDRQDIGFFVGQAGNDPRLTGGTCSVASFPTSPLPFEDNDGDACGDFNGGGVASPLITGVKVACEFGTDPANPDTYGKLLLPFVLTYWQNGGNVCTGPEVVVGGNSSKCNSGVGTVSGVTLTGYVDVIKQTLPDGDPTLFDFTTSGSAPFDAATDGAFQLSDGQSNRIETIVDTATQTITVTESSTTGWSDTASISCVDYLGNPTDGFVTTDGANRTFTAALDIAHPAVVCTITNSRGTPLTIGKTWVNAIVGDTVEVTATGGAVPASLSSVADTANETDTAAPVLVNAGDVITFAESFSVGAATYYDASVSCTGNANPLVGNVLTVHPSDTAVSCVQTNARVSTTLMLQKTWQDAVPGDAVTVSTTGAINNATLDSTADTASETDAGIPVTVFAGEAITIGETFTTGVADNYLASLACTGTGSSPLAGNLLTVAADATDIVCTQTNARRSATLTLAKTWANALVSDAVSLTATGTASTASLASVANTPSETDTGAPVVVFAGESLALAETFDVGTAANYASSLSCIGNGTPLAGNVLAVTAADTAVTCTFTNARQASTLTVAKTWVGARVGDAVTVSTTGAASNATLDSVASSANETDTGTAVTVLAGEVLSIGETFTTGSPGDYTASLSCTGLGSDSTLAGNVLTIGSEPGAIVCTQTNARLGARFTLAKAWVGAAVNDAATVTASSSEGGSVILASTADTANETDAAAAVDVSTGEVLTISETITTGASADYQPTLSCAGNSIALAGNQLTVSAADTDIVCTQTNTRRRVEFTLAKTWVNARVNDAVTVTAAGAATPASLASVADTANETDTGTPVQLLPGEMVTISESFTTGAAADYSASLDCTGNSLPLAGNVLTIGTGDTAITCTQTNRGQLLPGLTVVKSAAPGIFVVGQPATYPISVTNTGQAPTSGAITVTDTLPTGISFVSASGVGWSCIGTTSLTCTFAGTLAPGIGTTLTVHVMVGAAAVSGTNVAVASGGGDPTCPAAPSCSGTVQVPVEYGDALLNIVKTASPVRIDAGSLVLYTLSISNISQLAVLDAQVFDQPPNGLAYVAGSGTIHDDDAANDAVSGARPIIFSGVDIAVGQTIRIQYLLRAGAALASGEYTNTAVAYQFGRQISNRASATVYAQTGADPLLEQTRILGKVWDDQDGDGWQDPGERGVPGVRLASVDGLVSETDAHGRYHMEGLVLTNQERGQNFILKLDAATLPPGAAITTENPLVRRITAAIPARFDFGVRLPAVPAPAARRVEMDLGEINFSPGSTEIRPEYQGVLDRMAEQIRSHHSGEVFIDSASGSSPLAFERASRVRDQLLERLSAEQREAFAITLRLQANDGSTGQLTVSDTVKLGEVLFDTDKSNIRPEFEPLLDRVAAAIESVGAGRVTLVGHADLRHSVEYNQALGMRRAKAVYEHIAKRLGPEARTKLSVEVEGAEQVPGAGL